MTEYVPIAWNDKSDAAFFAITDALSADGFTEDALLATALTGPDLAAQIDKVLADLAVAESWESMATRSAAGSAHHRRDLVPVPVAARRRAA